MINLVLSGIVIGAGATIAMDLWAFALFKAFGIPMPNWANVGRWFWHLGSGRVFHDDIGTAEPHPNELAIGWFAHYAVGVIYGVLFLLIVGANWMDAPSFIPAWVFAILTISAGWFLLQPGMGLGWAASKTPNPWKVRGLGLLAHTSFGLGMWVTATLI